MKNKEGKHNKVKNLKLVICMPEARVLTISLFALGLPAFIKPVACIVSDWVY